MNEKRDGFAEMENADISESARQWLEFTRRLGEAGLKVHCLADKTRTAPQQAEINQTLMLLLSGGALCQTQFDPDYPDWMPFWNSTYLSGASNSDNSYYFTRISGDGQYSMTGERGSGGRVDLQVVKGMVGVTEPGPVLSGFDIDDFEIAPDGTFEIILSAKRPDGYTGNWVPLDASVEDTILLVRRIYHDWENDRDGYFTIQRMDKTIDAPRRGKDINQKLDQVANYVDKWATEFHNILERQGFDAAEANVLENYTLKFGTITLQDQHYFGGKIRLSSNEALIIEADIPDDCQYWMVQLLGNFFSALDYTFHQASLNSLSAHVDADGKIRLVVSEKDPGVANWLDKSDYDQVAIRFRSYKGGVPVLTTRKLLLSDVRKALPPDTPAISHEQRQDALRRRIRAVQKRRRW